MTIAIHLGGEKINTKTSERMRKGKKKLRGSVDQEACKNRRKQKKNGIKKKKNRKNEKKKPEKKGKKTSKG